MIITGAGGFAKEVIDKLEIISKFSDKELFFYDDVNLSSERLFGFRILHDLNEAEHILDEISPDFCLGVGTPKNRYLLAKKFERIGGSLKSVISANSSVAKYSVTIGPGCCIMDHCSISNEVEIGPGTLINSFALIAHDVQIGKYCDIAPGVRVSGNCEIGNYVSIGTGVIILPKVKIGNNCFIGAGSVIATDVPDNSVVVGIVPSRVINKLPDFVE